jgi:hypothetical protein
MLTRVQVIYGFWIVVILFILSILIVTGVLWTDYTKYAWYYLVLVGLGFLYLGSLAMATSDSLGSLLSNMAEVASQKLSS